MQVPLQITERNITLSKDQKDRIRDKAEKLERFHDRITSCRVTVEIPHRHHRKGTAYDFGINVTVPGEELVVHREAEEDLEIALREAFDAMRRQLEDHARRARGDVKKHAGKAPAE